MPGSHYDGATTRKIAYSGGYHDEELRLRRTMKKTLKKKPLSEAMKQQCRAQGKVAVEAWCKARAMDIVRKRKG